MILDYFVIISFALFAIGISGAFASRHVILIIISTELIIVASALLGISFFDFYGGDILPFLFSVWAIAAVGIVLLIIFYRALSSYKQELDVTKLSKLRG